MKWINTDNRVSWVRDYVILITSKFPLITASRPPPSHLQPRIKINNPPQRLASEAAVSEGWEQNIFTWQILTDISPAQLLPPLQSRKDELILITIWNLITKYDIFNLMMSLFQGMTWVAHHYPSRRRCPPIRGPGEYSRPMRGWRRVSSVPGEAAPWCRDTSRSRRQNRNHRNIATSPHLHIASQSQAGVWTREQSVLESVNTESYKDSTGY